MARSNEELARDAYAAINRGDLEGFVELIHPNVEFTSLTSEAEGGADRGHAGSGSGGTRWRRRSAGCGSSPQGSRTWATAWIGSRRKRTVTEPGLLENARMAAEMTDEDVEFDVEPLLKGLQGEAREARTRLLARLSQDGVTGEELSRAVAEDRLVLVPVERALGGGSGRHTLGEVAKLAGIERELVERYWQALGMAVAADDQARFTDRDLAAARRIAEFRDAGLPDEGILEIARLLGMTMSQLAAANRRLIADTFLRAGETEYEVAMRFADAAQAFMPAVGESLSYVLELHLREQIRHDAIGAAELSAGRFEAGQEVAVCFADMVSFTQLGESLEPDELGRLTGRLTELVAEVVEPPVRLIKMIGDAAMFVGPESGPVVDAALTIVEAAEREGKGFPQLRAGVASGTALSRGGDWYGRPVNLASRITTRARPSSVLASEEVHDALEHSYRWSFAGAKRLKGIGDETKLWRCRLNEEPIET